MTAAIGTAFDGMRVRNNLDPAGRVRPFRFFEKGGLADGSEGEDRPDHQRLSRKGQHSADHGFEIAH